MYTYSAIEGKCQQKTYAEIDIYGNYWDLEILFEKDRICKFSIEDYLKFKYSDKNRSLQICFIENSTQQGV